MPQHTKIQIGSTRRETSRVTWARRYPLERCRYAKTMPREPRGKVRYRMRRNTPSIYPYRPASSAEAVNCRACVPERTSRICSIVRT